MEDPWFYFMVAFAIAVLWYRVLFVVFPSYANRPLTRTVLKVRWHHLHWGIILTVVAIFHLYATEMIGTLNSVLLGLGLGLW